MIGKTAVLIEPAVKIPTSLKPAPIKMATTTHVPYINNTEPTATRPPSHISIKAIATTNTQPKEATTSASPVVMVVGIFCKEINTGQRNVHERTQGVEYRKAHEAGVKAGRAL